MFRKVAFALVLLTAASAASASNHECISGWHQVYPVVSCESSADHTKPTVTKPTYTKPHDTKPPSNKPPIVNPPPPKKPPVTNPPPVIKPPVTKSPVTYPPPPPVTKSPLTAPEIDPSSTIAGMTMLTGLMAVLRGRRRLSLDK